MCSDWLNPSRLNFACLGSRRIDLEPEQNCCYERNGVWKYLRALVIAGCHTYPILQSAKHYLNPVSSLVSTPVILDDLAALFSDQDTRCYTHAYKSFAKPICNWEAAYKSASASLVADLLDGYEEPNRPPSRIRNGMQFRAHTALRATNQTSTPPFSTSGSTPLGVLLSRSHRLKSSCYMVPCHDPRHLLIAQPKKIAHQTPLSLEV